MIVKVRAPKISANVEEETITGWLKNEGDSVKKGDPLVEITTDKVCVEMEAPQSGVLRKILAKEKSILPVGYVIALIGKASDPLPDVTEENKRQLERLRKSAGKAERGRTSAVGSVAGVARVRATPAARRLARERNVDLAAVKQASGADIVTEELVAAHLAGEKP